MRPLAIALALTLAACATPAPRTILVPCKAPAVEKPVFPFDLLPVDADLFTKVKTLLADRKVRQGYETKLEASNEVCSRG